MRTYLVVIDDSPEATLALRFAARRAARTGGGVMVLAIVPPQDFVAFGGVQATIEAERMTRSQRSSLPPPRAERRARWWRISPGTTRERCHAR